MEDSNMSDKSATDKEKLENLTSQERMLLEAYALRSDDSYYGLSESFIKLIDVDARQKRKIDEKLIKDGFLVKGYYGSKQINYAWAMKVIVNMVENHPDDTRIFLEFFDSGHRRMYLEPIMNFIHALQFALGIEKNQTVRPISSGYCQLLIYVIGEKWLPRLLMFLPSEEHLAFAQQVLTQSVCTDTPLSPEELDSFTTTLTTDKGLAQNLLGLRMLYAYILDGTFTNDKSVPVTNPYRQILLGIRAANQGKYEDALTYFTYALKVLNKNQALKNVFYHFFPSYYLIMTYVRLNTAATNTKLSQYLRKKDISSYYDQFIPVALAYAHTNISHTPDVYLLNKASNTVLNGVPADGLTYMGLMVARYFGVSYNPRQWSTFYDDPQRLPRHLLTRHEVAKYLTLSAEQRKELEKLYGTLPILTSIQKKEDWEWVIDDVMQQVGEEKEAEQKIRPVKKERIIYYVFEGRDEMVPMTQTWLKSERWSVPKNITMKRFISGELPFADDVDKEIADIVRKKNFDSYYTVWPQLEDVGTLLIDFDRAFLSSDIECRHPLEFRKEEVCVTFAPSKTGDIKVEMNVEKVADEISLGRSVVVDKGADGVYNVIRVNQRQAAVIDKLRHVKEFPKRAEEQVKTMLTRLEDIIDVKSPLLDSKSIPNVKGSTVIYARIRPGAMLTYTVNFMVLPAQGGEQYYFPGEGKSVIYDIVDGKNVRAKRNLSGEMKAFGYLVDELSFIDEAYSDNGFTYSLDIDSVLDIIECAKGSEGRLVVEWEEGKALSVNRANPSTWNVGLKSGNEWFEIEGEVRVSETSVITMSELLEKITQSRGRYVRLNDTDYLEISAKLRKQLERIDALAVKHRGHMMVSTFNAALLDDKALDGELKVAFDDRLVELRKRISDSYDYEPEVPKALNAQLRPYQLEGFQWMARLSRWGAGACLADDMGLGKTVQTIAFLLLKAHDGPALVVAPASVVPNWVGEIARFAPSLNVAILNKAADRAQLIKDAGAYDVVLSTYGILSTEETALAEKKWTTVCLDEAHVIKNKDTKMSQAVMTLSAENRLILTGTPIQNHLGELWNLFRFINPGLLGSDESFRRKFVIPIQEHDKDRQRALQRVIKPFMLRRTKAEVADDLPEKTDIVIPVELSDREMAMYEAMRIKAASAIEASDKVDVNTLAEITRLRRAACSMELVDPGWKGPESKIQTFLDLVEEFRTGSNRMLVFSQFTSFLALVKAALDKAGIPYLYLDGSCSMKEREKIVGEFRKGDIPLFLISLKAGGLGLNLPEANYVAHLDPWWNPAIEQQATDRAYRIGQKRNVTVYHFVSKNTIEEKIRRLHRTKRDLADSLLEGTDMASKLGMKEILELVDA